MLFFLMEKIYANVSLNHFYALVFKRSVSVLEKKLEIFGYEMLVNNRVAGDPMVQIAPKRESCPYIL